MRIVIVVESGCVQQVVFDREDDMPLRCPVDILIDDKDVLRRGEPEYGRAAVEEDRQRVRDHWHRFVAQEPDRG